MEYKGKLYGKVGKSYFPLEETTEDFELLKKRVLELQEECVLLHHKNAKRRFHFDCWGRDRVMKTKIIIADKQSICLFQTI